MEKTLMENIEAFIVNNKKVIEFGTGKQKFNIEINEAVDVDDIHRAIDLIVDQVIEQDYSYELIDVLMPYYLIKLFTNIPVPMLEEDIPDYKRCLDFCINLQLKEKLFAASPVVAEYISILEKNVWRKLEYKKARLTLIPWESLMDGLGQFYEILDTFSEFVDQQKNIDVDSLASQINDVASTLSLVEEMKSEK